MRHPQRQRLLRRRSLDLDAFLIFTVDRTKKRLNVKVKHGRSISFSICNIVVKGRFYYSLGFTLQRCHPLRRDLWGESIRHVYLSRPIAIARLADVHSNIRQMTAALSKASLHPLISCPFYDVSQKIDEALMNRVAI
uniref:Uncharacterized protein n=1 Tax=Panagrellus redivivus TaxID=6233 RepID=A0A7E4W8H7_PANRE